MIKFWLCYYRAAGTDHERWSVRPYSFIVVNSGLFDIAPTSNHFSHILYITGTIRTSSLPMLLLRHKGHTNLVPVHKVTTKWPQALWVTRTPIPQPATTQPHHLWLIRWVIYCCYTVEWLLAIQHEKLTLSPNFFFFFLLFFSFFKFSNGPLLVFIIHFAWSVQVLFIYRHTHC